MTIREEIKEIVGAVWGDGYWSGYGNNDGSFISEEEAEERLVKLFQSHLRESLGRVETALLRLAVQGSGMVLISDIEEVLDTELKGLGGDR